MYFVSRLMICCISLVLVCLFSPSRASSSTANTTVEAIAGYGFELMMAKLDYLQYKLHELEFGLKERDEEIAEKLLKFDHSLGRLQYAITRHDQDAGLNLTNLQDQSQKLLSQQAACANHEQMRKDIALLTAGNRSFSQNLQSLLALQAGMQKKQPVQSCKDVPTNDSGGYWVRPAEKDKPFEVFCELNSFGGGWMVFHYRFDGTLDFYRNWTEYRNGFGNVYREFWMGLERLHQLTSQRKYELMVELKDFDGTYKYAHYTEFQIGSETEQYTLKKLGAFDGTAGDSLGHHAGAKFSTKDRDNDENGSSCANAYEGAWWYRNCHASNLNGRYRNKDDSKSMCWHAFRGNYQGLAYSRMMIREV